MSSVAGMKATGSVRRPGGVVHEERSDEARASSLPWKKRRGSVVASYLIPSCDGGSRREHKGKVLPEARMMRSRGGCNTGAGSVRHSSRGGRRASARRRKAEAARCPSKAQGARQRRVGVTGTSSKCGEVQNESCGIRGSSKQTQKACQGGGTQRRSTARRAESNRSRTRRQSRRSRGEAAGRNREGPRRGH